MAPLTATTACSIPFAYQSLFFPAYRGSRYRCLTPLEIIISLLKMCTASICPKKTNPPSLRGNGEDPEAVTADLFNAQKVRGIVTCWECYKSRVVYSKGKLTVQERNALTEVDDSRVYTCGSMLFSPSSDFKSLVVRQNIQCTSPIEAQYYSAKLVNFPPVCYYCGGSEETLVNVDETTELKQQYAVVRPICFLLCKASGKKIFTSHPSNVKKRRKTS